MSSVFTNTACGRPWNKTSSGPAVSDRDFEPPVQAVEGGWTLNFDDEERAFLTNLLEELRGLVTGPADDPLVDRLFPKAYRDDEEMEAEYQRLMRDELVVSRVAALDSVIARLEAPEPEIMDEGETVAFMQSLNAIRMVLGSIIGITDDESADQADASDSMEMNLYEFLSWVLDWTVRSLSPN